MAQKKKGPKKGRTRSRSGEKVTALSDAPRRISAADYPLIEHALEFLLKHIAKVRKGLRELSLPVAMIDNLKAQAEEAERLLRKAKGDTEHAPTETFSLPAHVSAAVRVGIYLHLAALEKIANAQEKQGVVEPGDTLDLIRSCEKLADRLSAQLSLIGDGGVNQVTLDVTRVEDEPEPAPAAEKPEGEKKGDGQLDALDE